MQIYRVSTQSKFPGSPEFLLDFPNEIIANQFAKHERDDNRVAKVYPVEYEEVDEPE